jgi:biopolymer transport protein ExbB/TolQ
VANDLLAEAEAVGTAIRDAVREGHTLLRDLKAATKEARDVLAAIDQHIYDRVDETIDREVKEGLDRYQEALTEAIERADAAVNKRFDTLASILLGEDPKSRREGKPTLVELAEQRRPSTLNESR